MFYVKGGLSFLCCYVWVKLVFCELLVRDFEGFVGCLFISKDGRIMVRKKIECFGND